MKEYKPKCPSCKSGKLQLTESTITVYESFTVAVDGVTIPGPVRRNLGAELEIECLACMQIWSEVDKGRLVKKE